MKRILTGMIAIIASFVLITPTTVLAADTAEGRDYEVLMKTHQASAPAGKVEVLEFFWYGCPHCYKYMRASEKWKNPAAEVTRETPSFSDRWRLGGTAYHAMVSAGGFDETLHVAFFKAFHEDGKRMDASTFVETAKRVRGEAYASKFSDHLKGFSVEGRARASAKKADDYGVRGTPSIIVAGKYRVAPDTVKSNDPNAVYERMVAAVDYLVKKEASALRKGK